MRHWLGKPVIVYLGEPPYVTLRGVLRKWDAAAGRIVVGHQETGIPIRNIAVIKALAPKERALPPVLHSVGYIMKDRLQFDNAVYFKSAVTVWKGDRLIALNTTLVSHTKGSVTLEDGRTLVKSTHLFVVRSLRG